MNSLVQIEDKPRRSLRATAIHALRVAMLAAIVLMLHQIHDRLRREAALRPLAVEAADLKSLFKAPVQLSDQAAADGGRRVVDPNGEVAGWAMQTMPEANRIIGFSGPTNVLLAFDTDACILGMRILQSGDTEDHVRDILRDPMFLESLNGLTKQEAVERAREVDGVSGATLTSLAIMEGVIRRLARPTESASSAPTEDGGGNVTAAVPSPASLRFPQPLSVEDAQKSFPKATRVEPRSSQPRLVDIFDAQNERLGAMFRTAPEADSIIGYQGPTDSLVFLDTSDRVLRLAVRRSYDNEPYVGYVREDEYHAELLKGRTLQQLSTLDPIEEQIEGVSGATMTSVAMVDALPAAATAAMRQEPPATSKPAAAGKEQPGEIVVRERGVWRLRARDVGTVIVLLAALTMAFAPRLRGRRRLRIGFQLGLIGYLGFLNGDMLSQAQLLGWSSHGAAWRLAPGLTLLTIAALLVPLTTKRNVYCHQVCPFGAAQQLVRPGKRRRLSLGKFGRALTAVPFLLLGLCVTATLMKLPLNLAAVEPFDAFLFGATASIVIAVIGLVASAFSPMAYCRFGCPTGSLLEYLRFRSTADRIGWRDMVVCGLVVFAGYCWLGF